LSETTSAQLHDAYAADYDAQVVAHDCYITDVLFGLCYQFIQPGQRLLDLGIGSGLSAQLFFQAGLEVYGMDFSRAMLDICQAKGFSADLKQHDLLQIPWPYPPADFDHLICCGVFHFIPDLELIFSEARRVLAQGGHFAFTTRLPTEPISELQKYQQQRAGDFEIFSHTEPYIETLLAQQNFIREKIQRCFVGDDLFVLWVARLIESPQIDRKRS
jgi:predicted TPR repeat methyltransferase